MLYTWYIYICIYVLYVICYIIYILLYVSPCSNVFPILLPQMIFSSSPGLNDDQVILQRVAKKHRAGRAGVSQNGSPPAGFSAKMAIQKAK